MQVAEDDIDLIAGSKEKRTDLTSRLTYQYIDGMAIIIETSNDTVRAYHQDRETLHPR